MTQAATEISRAFAYREYQDAYLPYLSELQDVTQMAEVLLGALFQVQAKAWIVTQCRLDRIKYKPAKNCLAVYMLNVRNRQNGKSESFRISCRTYEQGGSLRRYQKAVLENSGKPYHRRGVFHVPDLALVGWVFPCERKLIALPFFNNSHYLKHVMMPQLVRQYWGKNWSVRKVSSAIIHYVPEHTCNLKVELVLSDSQTGMIKNEQVYGKCYYNDDGAQTYRVMRWLAAQFAHQTTPLKFPEPLHYDVERRTLWQQGLAGQTLRDAGVSNLQDSQLLELAGRSVAQFHQLVSPPGLVEAGTGNVLSLLELRLQQLRSVQMLDQKRLHRLVRLLNEKQTRLQNDSPVTLHGDVHPQNLFIHDGQIAFIDLDNVSLGPRLLDLASWIGGMVYWGVLQKTPRAMLLGRIQAFVAAYINDLPGAVNNRDLGWYLAAALINERIFRCITRMKSGRMMIVNDLLAYAQDFANSRYRLTP